MNIKKFIELYETLDITNINHKKYTDGYETDLDIFICNKTENISISKFYAICVKKYYKEILSYTNKESLSDYSELIENSQPRYMSSIDAISKIKKWMLYTNKNLNINKEINSYTFNDEDCFINTYNESDFIIILINSLRKYYFFIGSC